MSNDASQVAIPATDDLYDPQELFLPEGTKGVTISEAVELFLSVTNPPQLGEWTLDETEQEHGSNPDNVLAQTKEPHQTSLYRRNSARAMYRAIFHEQWLSGGLALYDTSTKACLRPIEGVKPHWPAVERGIMALADFTRIARDKLRIIVELQPKETQPEAIEDRRMGRRDYRLQKYANEVAEGQKKQGKRPSKHELALFLCSMPEFKADAEFCRLQPDRIERILRVEW